MKLTFSSKVKILISIFLIATIIPLANIAAMSIFDKVNIYTYLDNALFFIFAINPLLIVLSLCFIKKFSKLSQIVIAATSINFLCWIILAIPAVQLQNLKNQKTEQEYLKIYDIVIKNLYNYKRVYNQFPDNINKIKVPTGTDSTYTYTRTNQDFVLQINRNSQIIYLYCSNDQAPECNKKDNSIFLYKKIGQWVKLEEID